MLCTVLNSLQPNSNGLPPNFDGLQLRLEKRCTHRGHRQVRGGSPPTLHAARARAGRGRRGRGVGRRAHTAGGDSARAAGRFAAAGVALGGFWRNGSIEQLLLDAAGDF